ncbi:phage portal protein [Clostridioides difficile]|nr:phage portal protein [Clostridioides difficile]
MELEKIRAIISADIARRQEILQAKSYYYNENDILKKGVVVQNRDENPLRNADNRISHNFHEILVDEKASYMFTYPVLFDIDNNKELNEKVTDVLGNEFTRKAKNLAIEASNCGTAWLHYWIDEEYSGEQVINQTFKYGVVNTEEIIPIYQNGIERELEAVIRYYVQLEDVERQIQKQPYTYVEFWTDKVLNKYKFFGVSCCGSQIEHITVQHRFNSVPFIEFANNIKKQSDLSKYKSVLDLYDKIMSGFANDLEDIQQIIYILENYGGEDTAQFLNELKRYKAIKTETDSEGDSGGLKTMQIEIPTEARRITLEILKKQIYESGQGLQQDTESFGNASGVALKFFYRKLELKSGLLETEFRTSFDKLVKAILYFLGVTDYKKIQQTYTRNMMSNDLEDADIATKSVGIIPTKIILRHHPWIDDPEEAERLYLEEKKIQASKVSDDYNNFTE